MIQNLTISVNAGVSVTARYPTIQVTQVTVGESSGDATVNTDNMRQKVGGGGTFTQIKDPNTGLWHTVMVTGGQVVVGAGES
jgi:hypothetical protein